MWRGYGFGRFVSGRYAGSASAPNKSETPEQAVDRLLRSLMNAHNPGVGFPQGQPIGGDLFEVVLDIDAEAGGLASWKRLTKDLGVVPITARVLTKTKNSFHVYLVSQHQGKDLPQYLDAGIELKRAGHYVAAPPTPGYRWDVHPGAVGRAHWPLLDEWLSELPPLTPVTNLVKTTDAHEWSRIDDCLRAITSAPPGDRTTTLLEAGGLACFLHAIGQGFETLAELEAEIRRAVEECGLADDYPDREIDRKVGYVLTLADARTNPYLGGTLPRRGKKPASGAGSTTFEAVQGLKRPAAFREPSVSEQAAKATLPGRTAAARNADREVLLGVVKRHGWSAQHSTCPYSKRYGASHTGLPQQTVSRALTRLVLAGYLVEGPRKRVEEGKKKARTFKPSPAGVAFARQLSSGRTD
jgi:hypothetical protein